MRERSSEEEDEKEETVLREEEEEEEEEVIVDICAGQGQLKFLSRAAKTKTSVTPPLLREGNSIILEVKDLCEYAEENEEEKSKVPWVEHKFAIGDSTHPEGLEEALLKMRGERYRRGENFCLLGISVMRRAFTRDANDYFHSFICS